MAVEILMPRLSDSMEEATILRWFVAEGDAVKQGDPLLEVETDKATVTYESEVDGTMLQLAAKAGDTVAVFTAIGVIGEPGDLVSTATAKVAASSRVKASPLARRVAAALGVDLTMLVGTGPQGRVIRADVERHAGAPGTGDGVAAVTVATELGAAKGETISERLSRLQQTVARRMSESRATVPDFELRCEIDMRRAFALREQLKEVSEQPPSYNDLIVKAAALALREFPRVNGAYRDGAFEQYTRVNVGIAVAANDALVVPTIFDADTRSLADIATTSRELAAKVRDGSITPAELSGGTFSVSNLGMFGIDGFSAVINAPEAAILAVGSLKPRPVVADDGTIVARPTINVSLACDHRILYGADGARFLARVRELLETPVALLL